MTTTKIPVEFLNALSGTEITDGSIGTADIADSAITTAKIAANAITATQLPDNVITATHIPNGLITGTHMAGTTLTATQIANNAIGTDQLAGIARGKIIYGDSNGDPQLLTVGSANQVLISDGADISWGTNTHTDTTKLPLAGGTLTGDLILGDNVKLEVGSASGGDLQIYHDGSNSYIKDAGTGQLVVQVSDIVIDAEGDIVLDADGGDWRLKDGGTTIVTMSNVSGDFYLKNNTTDKDIKFYGDDNGSEVLALTLDMSAAGAATFNSSAYIQNGGEVRAYRSGNSAYASMWLDVGENLYIRNSYANKDLVFNRDGKLGIGTATPKNTLDLGAATLSRGLTFTNYSNLFSEYSNGSLWLSSNFYGNAGASGYKTGATGNYGAAGIRVHGTGGSSSSGIIQFYTDTNTSKTADAAFTPTERMRIAADGSVGIANTTPDSYYANSNQLVVGSGAARQGITIASSTTTIGQLAFADGTSGDARYEGSIVYNHNDNHMELNTNHATAIYIDSAQKVGIGTTGPTGKLHVYGGKILVHDSAGSGGEIFGYDEQHGIHWRVGGTNKTIYYSYGDTLANSGGHNFYAQGMKASQTLKMKISNDGVETSVPLTIPNTSAANVNNESHVLIRNLANGQIVTDGLTFNCAEDKLGVGTGLFLTSGYIRSGGSATIALGTAAGGQSFTLSTGKRQYLNTSSTVTGHANFIGEVGANMKAVMFEHTNGGGEVGTIVTSASATAYNTSSDYRLKDYTWDATTRLKQLKPARFNWISDGSNTLLEGFLAHEVSSIVPEAVSGEKDAMTDPTLYIEGEELPEGKSVGDIKIASVPDHQGIDQSKLVPLLVKTIQELEARITTLEG